MSHEELDAIDGTVLSEQKNIKVSLSATYSATVLTGDTAIRGKYRKGQFGCWKTHLTGEVSQSIHLIWAIIEAFPGIL